jgi:hypothetical protein
MFDVRFTFPPAHGTMIFIPRHVSLDHRGDLDRNLINRLHRCRGAKKQGAEDEFSAH